MEHISHKNLLRMRMFANTTLPPPTPPSTLICWLKTGWFVEALQHHDEYVMWRSERRQNLRCAQARAVPSVVPHSTDAKVAAKWCLSNDISATPKLHQRALPDGGAHALFYAVLGVWKVCMFLASSHVIRGTHIHIHIHTRTLRSCICDWNNEKTHQLAFHMNGGVFCGCFGAAAWGISQYTYTDMAESMHRMRFCVKWHTAEEVSMRGGACKMARVSVIRPHERAKKKHTHEKWTSDGLF